jgi:hypothetical protein
MSEGEQKTSRPLRIVLGAAGLAAVAGLAYLLWKRVQERQARNKAILDGAPFWISDGRGTFLRSADNALSSGDKDERSTFRLERTALRDLQRTTAKEEADLAKRVPHDTFLIVDTKSGAFITALREGGVALRAEKSEGALWAVDLSPWNDRANVVSGALDFASDQRPLVLTSATGSPLVLAEPAGHSNLVFTIAT